MLERVLALALLVGTLAGAAPARAGIEPDGSEEQAGFGVVCGFSHRAKDDPIVFPDRPGMAHSHDFIGNRRTNAFSTYEDMVGNPSTCDRSAAHRPRPRRRAWPCPPRASRRSSG